MLVVVAIRGERIGEKVDGSVFVCTRTTLESKMSATGPLLRCNPTENKAILFASESSSFVSSSCSLVQSLILLHHDWSSRRIFREFCREGKKK